MLIFAQLEDAAIARIKAASDTNALGYKVPEIASYGGQLDDDTLFQAVRRLPAVWVTVGGDRPARRLGRKTVLGLTLAVMVATRNVRGERATRHGTVGEPGTYQMVEDVRDLLTGQAMGLAIAPLRVGAVRTLYNTRQGNEARSVFALEFSTDYTYTPPEDAALDLNVIGLNYYLQPDDGVLDASDVIPNLAV